MIQESDYFKNAVLIRRKILEMAYKSGTSSHIGGSLSIVDILSVLYSSVLKISPTTREEICRDRFILSKGHAALALYATLHVNGFIDDEITDTYMRHGSHLIAHPIKDLSLGIESSNGSLGQGLSFGAGLATAFMMQNSDSMVYVLLGDGECNEGSVWEAAMYAGSNRLSNLTAIVDWNRLQSDGALVDQISDDAFLSRWQSFGWETLLIDGHNCEQIKEALTRKPKIAPRCLIASTKKGKGIDFMESNNNWHHAILSKQKFEEAIMRLS